MALLSPVTASQRSISEFSCQYELIEDLQVDLAVSVKSRMGSKWVNEFVRIVARSPLTYLGFMSCTGITTAVFVVRADVGQLLAAFAFIVGLPTTLLTTAMLRFETVVVLLRTFDIWFFAVTSTLMTIFLAGMLRDHRGGFVGVTSWLAFLLNIEVDANLFGLRRAWIANTFSTAFYAFVAVSGTIGLTPSIKDFAVLSLNGHEVLASGLVRDSTVTLLVVVLRNVLRRHHFM